MTRLLGKGAVAIGAALVLAAGLQAQVIDAEITYYHRTKKAQDKIKGTIVEESPGLIAYRLSNRVEKVPAVDVVDVEYFPTSAVLRGEVRKALRAEDEVEKATDADTRKKSVQKAIEAYQILMPQLTESRYAQRHAAFKIARLTTRLAEDDPGQRDAAIGALGKFLQEHGTGWQVGTVAKILAQLQLDKGDVAGAQKTFENLANKPDISKEIRQEYQMLAARAMMRSNKFDEAQKQLRALQSTLPPEDPVRIRAGIYLAGCQGAVVGQLAEVEKQLKPVFEGTAEPPLKALALNTLGEVYLKAGRGEDAFWRFLMVDTLYGQDTEEHARALYHLSHLFEKVKKNTTRAQECRKRLLEEKQFAGAEYRQMALKEK